MEFRKQTSFLGLFLVLVCALMVGCQNKRTSSTPKVPAPGDEKLPQIVFIEETIKSEKVSELAFNRPHPDWLSGQLSARVESLIFDGSEESLERLKNQNSRRDDLWIVFSHAAINYLPSIPLQTNRKLGLLDTAIQKQQKWVRKHASEGLFVIEWEKRKIDKILSEICGESKVAGKCVFEPAPTRAQTRVGLGPIMKGVEGERQESDDLYDIQIGVDWVSFVRKLLDMKLSHKKGIEKISVDFKSGLLQIRVSPEFKRTEPERSQKIEGALSAWMLSELK